MSALNENEVFQPIWLKIKSSEIQTSNDLKVILDDLGQQLNVSTLNLLVSFREWLLTRNVELLTLNGVVTFKRIEEESQKKTQSSEFVKAVSEEVKIKKDYISNYQKNNSLPSKREIDMLKELIEDGKLDSVDKDKAVMFGLIFIQEICDKYGLNGEVYKCSRFGNREEMDEAVQLEEIFDIANLSILDFWNDMIKLKN